MDLAKSIALAARSLTAQSGPAKSVARAIAEQEGGSDQLPMEPARSGEQRNGGPALREAIAATEGKRCRETNLRVVEATRGILVRAILMLR
jgi:flagellar basal body rod protein FlgC